MEQRAHIRHSVDLSAALATENADKHQCRVTDFCLGGVFTLLPGGDRHLLDAVQRGQSVALTLEVNGHRGPRRITLPARIARVAGDGLGLSFDAPNPADLLALQNHVRSLREGEASSAPRDFTAQRAKPILEDVAGALRGFLVERLETFFKQAEQRLTAEADKATSNEEQHPWFEAIDGLHQHAEGISRSFVQKALMPLQESMETPGRGRDWGQVQSRGSDSRLSLVDKELFEDWLTLKVMASRAEGRLHDQLLPLQLRFDELLGLGVGARRNPLHPAVIASAFGDSLKLVALKAKTDRTVLGAFEQVVLNDLEELYGSANQVLAQAGVLPDLDIGRYLAEHYAPKAEQCVGPEVEEDSANEAAGEQGVAPEPEPAPPAARAPRTGGIAPVDTAKKAQPSASVSPSAAPSIASSPANAPSPASPTMPESPARAAFAMQQRIANQAYDTVKRLLSARRSIAAPSGSAAAAEQLEPSTVIEVGAPVVNAALEGLQKAANDSGDQPLPERVQKAVAEEGGEPLQMDGELEAATEVIHHLFEGIGSNPALSDRVREAIRRLEVPFLRLLLQDEAFLHEEQHPARQMLNQIAHLGVRGNPNLPRYEEEIDQQVQEVIDRFSSDINVFEDTLDNLDKLTTQHSRLYQRNLSRVTEACEGRQKLMVARREVNQALERRIGGKKVPRAVLALIDAGWRELLVQTLLRQGRDSREWHQYLQVLDQMQQAAHAKPVQEELSRLLAAIKSGLLQVDETQVKNPALVGELRALLSVKARQEDGAPPQVEVPAGMVDPDESAEESMGERERRWRQRARRYEPGEWFEIRAHADEEMQQTRLAWVSADKEMFVFVNHQGLRVQEYPLNEFARQLESGAIRPIDSLDAPAVDRGLEQMVQRVYDQMAHQATHDELTGLYNRREFQRRVRQRLNEMDTGKPSSLVHFDVDQFKVVNNIGGPVAGDQLLCDLGELVRETLPGTLVARLGGDAFALWLEDLSEQAAVRAVRSLCERVESHRFQHGDQTHAVTLSCGLAHRQGPGDTADNLMQAAEGACQSAKESGRNRVHQYRVDDEDMLRRDDVMIWVTRLNEALDNDKLELRCQRIEATGGGDGLPSYEVLIAIKTDSGELVPPAEFVQAAERYNRMHAVDRWVIANVLRWMHANAEILGHVEHFSINLSGHSLNDVSLLEFLFEHFRRYPVPRNRLCFEVTETTAIANLEDAADFIRALQDLGCRFSLDDFGSGLASYGYLKHLPVDFIKIDGTFIRDLTSDPADLALVRSINEMGHLMGKQTIAEYVETDEIRQALLNVGVDFVQGFGVEKPRALDSLRELMAVPV